MIEQTGRVVACEGEYAWVETERQSSCGSCAAKGCGTGALSKVLGRRSQTIRVLNSIEAREGELVVLGIQEGALLRGSVAVYIVPLIAMLAGGLVGEALGPLWGISTEVGAFVLAAAGFVLALAWLRRFNRWAATDSRYQPVTLRRLMPTDDFITIKLDTRPLDR